MILTHAHNQQNDNKNFYFSFRFQAKMIVDKFHKNSIKKFQVLGKKELQQMETSAHNKILNLQISGFRKKVQQVKTLQQVNIKIPLKLQTSKLQQSNFKLNKIEKVKFKLQ